MYGKRRENAQKKREGSEHHTRAAHTAVPVYRSTVAHIQRPNQRASRTQCAAESCFSGVSTPLLRWADDFSGGILGKNTGRAKLIFFQLAPLAYAGAILFTFFMQVREEHSAAMQKFDRAGRRLLAAAEGKNAPPATHRILTIRTLNYSAQKPNA